GDWRAASARAEEPVWCGGDDVGRARPGPEALLATPAEADAQAMRAVIAAHRRSGRAARAVPSDCSGHIGGSPIDPGDVARLNSILVENLRFAVESTYSRGSICVGPDTCADTSPACEPISTARGVLIYKTSEGRQRTASFPVVCFTVRRHLLHSLSRSLAECAMTLGLGAGVYRESLATRATNRLRAADGSLPRRSAGLGKSP
ncbi:MAG: hypothetical protein KAW67_09545, partial [Candidatus Eisenbacteria sp.]|nr:hypothetical protein [Candidatus Eisenbacteria bacterium]